MENVFLICCWTWKGPGGLGHAVSFAVISTHPSRDFHQFKFVYWFVCDFSSLKIFPSDLFWGIQFYTACTLCWDFYKGQIVAVDLAWLPVCVRNIVCVLGERAINTSRNPLVFHPRCGSSVSLFNGFRSAHRPRLAFMLKFCGAF